MPLIIGALISALMTAARQFLPGIVGRVLLTLGIGMVVHKVALPAVLSLFGSYVNALPVVVRAYFGALGLDVVGTMILAALVAVRVQRFSLTKLAGGAA